MFDRNRLDQFSPKDFVGEPKNIEIFDEAHRIQQTGVALAMLREMAGLSVVQLADLARRDEKYIDRVERGQLLERAPESFIMHIAEVCLEEISRGQKRIAV